MDFNSNSVGTVPNMRYPQIKISENRTWAFNEEGITLWENYLIGEGIKIDDKELKICGTNDINVASTLSARKLFGVLKHTDFKQRKKLKAAQMKKKAERVKLKLKAENDRKVRRELVKQNSEYKGKKVRVKKLPIRRAICVNLRDQLNQSLCSPSESDGGKYGSAESLSTGTITVTLTAKLDLNEDCRIIDVLKLQCQESFRGFLRNGDKLLILNDEPVNSDFLQKIESASYPISATFKRQSPHVLPQGFARVDKAYIVTTPPTQEHKQYIEELYKAKNHLQGKQMFRLMNIRFPHPKNQLSVDQINNQIKANTKKKKKKR